MNKKLYVANLEWGVGDEYLRDFFLQAGKVLEATVILDRDTGRSRGFGFVKMASSEDAEKAIQQLDGKDLKGRRITVREANPEPAKEKLDFIGEIKRFVLSSDEPSMVFEVKGQRFTLYRETE